MSLVSVALSIAIVFGLYLESASLRFCCSLVERYFYKTPLFLVTFLIPTTGAWTPVTLESYCLFSPGVFQLFFRTLRPKCFPTEPKPLFSTNCQHQAKSYTSNGLSVLSPITQLELLQSEIQRRFWQSSTKTSSGIAPKDTNFLRRNSLEMSKGT